VAVGVACGVQAYNTPCARRGGANGGQGTANWGTGKAETRMTKRRGRRVAAWCVSAAIPAFLVVGYERFCRFGFEVRRRGFTTETRRHREKGPGGRADGERERLRDGVTVRCLGGTADRRRVGLGRRLRRRGRRRKPRIETGGGERRTRNCECGGRRSAVSDQPSARSRRVMRWARGSRAGLPGCRMLIAEDCSSWPLRWQMVR
jgi:hypothetical protein